MEAKTGWELIGILQYRVAALSAKSVPEALHASDLFCLYSGSDVTASACSTWQNLPLYQPEFDLSNCCARLSQGGVGKGGVCLQEIAVAHVTIIVEF